MITNLVVISDIHAGCQFALCPPRVTLDSGAVYKSSTSQQKLFQHWRRFWDVWVPTVTRGEKYAVVVNGDVMDGRHHGATTLVSQNLADQQKIAYELLAPIRDNATHFFMIRGTPVHSGEAGENEEKLADRLDCIPDENGNKSRHDMWIKVGDALCHIAHHIGTTSSMAYESTALMRELSEAYAESARYGLPAPDIVARAHRHRHLEIRGPSAKGHDCMSFTTASWQLKTPFVWKIHRLATPQIGGSLIRQGDEEFYTRHWVQTLSRSKTVKVEG